MNKGPDNIILVTSWNPDKKDKYVWNNEHKVHKNQL